VSGTSALYGKTVVAVVATGSSSVALCSDGTMVAWGQNGYGEFGNNSTDGSSVPVAVNPGSTSALSGKIVLFLGSASVANHSLALASPVPATVTTVATSAAGSYKVGDTLTFTLTLSAAATVDTTGGTPRLALTIGTTTRYATYVSGTGTTSLVFTYTVQAGDTDTDGIAVASSVDLNGGTITNATGVAINGTLPSFTLPAICIDTTAPAAPVVAVAGATSISGSAEASSTVEVFVDGVSVGTTTADSSGLWTFAPASALASGSHTVTATSTDAAGNGSGVSAVYAATISGSGRTWIVIDNSDNATAPLARSLRFALLHAVSGDAIRFSLPSGSETITLAAALPPIVGDLSIDGGTLGAVIIDGAGAYRVFFVDSGTVALSNLWIRNARAQGGAGGTGDGGGGGGAGLGAGLFVNQATAVVTVTNVNFISMSAAGGAGGSFVSHSYAGGGGGGMGFRGGMSTLNGGAPGGGGMLAPGADVTSGANGGAGGAGGGGGGGSYSSGTSGLGGSAYAGNDAGSAASTTNGGAGGFGGGGGGGPAGTGGAGGFGGGGGGTGISALGGVGGPGGGGGGSDGLQSTFAGGSLGSGVSGGQSGAGVGSGGGGGAAAGPAIFVRLGTLTTVNSAWSSASATGGAGGTGQSSHDGTAGTADATPTFNYGGTVNGSTATGPIPNALLSAVPTLSMVSLASNGATASLAKSGDTVTLSFAASRPIAAPTITLGGHSVTATNSSGNNWMASLTVGATDPEGAVAFSITFASTDGFAGTAVTATTDGSAVTIDLTAPTAPTGLAGSATSPTAIALGWTASTDTVGVTGYRIHRDGAAIGTSATTTYTDTGLTAGTAHTYTVTAYDALGNESAASASATVRTQLAGAQSIAVRTTDELLAALATAAANPSATFTITVAAGTYTPAAGLTLGSDGLVLEGSGTISGSGLASGALLTISGDNVVLSGLTFADGTVSVAIGADNGAIDECDFVRAGVAGTGCTGWSLTGNSFRDTTAAALTFAGADNLTFADNVVVDCAQAIVLNDLASPTVRNNFVANNRASAAQASIVLTNVVSARIDNNSVYQAGTAANAIEYSGSGAVGSIRNNLANKLVASTGGTATATLATNVATAQASWFKDPVAGDLHLAAARSGVVDAGTTIGDLLVDIDGGVRPIGTAYDIGADEYTADTTAPGAPTALTATAASSTAVTLSWTASTDTAPSGVAPTGVSGYRIYRNGVAVGTSATPSYSDTGLTAGTTYTYTVTAYDGAANESAASAAATVTTPAAPHKGGGGDCGPLLVVGLGLLAFARRRLKALNAQG